MYTWASFQRSIPALTSIEFAARQHDALMDLANLYQDILEQEASKCVEDAKQIREQILIETSALSAELCFWHFPFYPGDFLVLSKGLTLGGRPVKMTKTQMVRDRFRQFMRSAPESSGQMFTEKMTNPERKSLSYRLLRKLADRRKDVVNALSMN